MSTITLTLSPVGKADQHKAHQAVDQYRADGNGSNRTNWSRLALVAGAIATVVRTGKAVEVTELFADQIDAKAPAYNIAHRALSAGLVRPDWHAVRVVALADCQTGKGTVTGVSNTTARTGRVRLFYVPAV